MSNKIVKNKYSSSMKYCPDTLGLLLYGMDIAKEKNITKGKLIVSYDALKSKQDKMVIILPNIQLNQMERRPHLTITKC